MKLTVETYKIKDLRFSDETCLKDRVLYINKKDILAFAAEETCFDTLKIDITYPGDSTRIINVVDVVQPRCKVSGNIDWPGVLSEEYEISGSGVTRAVEGMGIVLCQNDTYWSRKWGSFDMSGECAAINPYAKMPELVIEPMAIRLPSCLQSLRWKPQPTALKHLTTKSNIPTCPASPIPIRSILNSMTRKIIANRCFTETPYLIVCR